MKSSIFAAALMLASGIAGAAGSFTDVPTLYTTTEQASIAAALSATSVSNAITQFDARETPMGHPRLFKGQADYAGIVAATKAERAVAVQSTASYLKRNPVANTSATVISHINSTDYNTRQSTWWQQSRILEGMAEAATVWYFTRDDWFLEEVRARMKLFAPAILSRNCSGDVFEIRDYAWFYALAYDMAYAGMTEADRQTVKDIIVSCGNAGLLKTPETVRKYPEHAISFNALGKFVGALLIVRGELPAADSWLEQTVQTYIDTLSPWGGPDGGFGNGSSYAEWETGESLLIYDLIDRVLGVPLLKKQWLAEFPRFIAYVLPPATPVGTFGDGAEVNRQEEWARFGKSIMNRSDTTLSRWYVKQQSGEDYARLHIILSPREYGSAVELPATHPNGAYFAAVGTAAMHSSLQDRLRTSVYFKSSPFGSVNHSHADQNSFVIYSKGKVLAMDSGYYDYYNSPHWREYYKQTRAHNAITVDGGIGQSLGASGLGERSLNGKLTRFTQTAAWDISTGDATAAYAGLLTQARRTVVFIRPSTVVTIDQLASSTPRRYEYNLHTSVPLNGNAASFRIDITPAQMCGTVASPAALTQVTTPGYSPAPTVAATPHYWNRFGTTDALTSGMIVSVLRTDCGIAAPVINFAGAGATINVAGRTVTVNEADVTVE